MRKHRILVVEDEAIIGMHIKSTLCQFGYDVIGVSASAKEAITTAREQEPDLLLMDIVMPGDMDGIDAAGIIKSTLDLPVVYLTGNADVTTVARARETNPYGYVLKPVNPQDLFSTIDTALHSHGLGKRLRENEEKLRKLTDNMRDMVGQIDRDTLIVYASSSHNKIAGYEPAELIGTSPMDLVHPDDKDGLRKAFYRGVEEHTDIRTEYRGRHKDGHYIWLETVNSFMYTPDGQFDGAVFSSRDISERKRVEALHRESEERYNALFSRSHDCVYVHDFMGNFIDANEAALQLFGYSKDEVKNVNFQSLVTEDQLPSAYEAMEEIFTTGFQEKNREFRVRTKKNETKHIDVMAMMLYREGKPDAVLGIARDVTEQKRTEQALRESEVKYRLIADMMTDVVWTVDMEFRYTYLSPSFEKVFGFSTEEIIGRSVVAMIGPEEYSRLLEIFMEEKRLRNSGNADPDRHVTVEHAAKHRNGSTVWLESVVGAIRDSSGDIVGLHGVSRDIRDRKKAEEVLREKEEQFRALFENSSAGIFMYDLDMTVTDCNRQFADMLMTKRENLIGLNLNLLRETQIVKSLVEALEGKLSVYKGPYRATTTGAVPWISSSATPLRDARGGIVGGLGIVVDITDMISAREAVREREERFSAVFDQSPVGIFTYNSSMVLTGANSRFATILDSTIEKLVGLDLTRLKEKAVIPVLEEALRGKVTHYEGPYHATTSDAFRWVRFSASPLRGPDGEVTSGIGVVVDITDSKLAEEALRESEERYRNLFDNANDIVVTADLDLNFTSINKKALEVTGYSQEDLSRLRVPDIVAPEYLDVVMSNMRKKIEGGAPTRYEMEILTRNGERVPLEINTQLVFRDGTLAGVQGIARDISERKRMEERIRTALAEKETLLREVHHRVKNNFQVITSLMALQAAAIQSPELRTSFIDAQSRIRSMSLIHEKLYQSDDLSRIDSSSYVKTIVQELYGSFMGEAMQIPPRVDTADIRLSVDQAIPCGLIINELVTNSFRHAFPAGWKGSPEVLVSIRESGGRVEMVLADNGIGLPESADLNKTKSLGLSLVPMLVRQLEGTIVLERSPGTRAIITFQVK